MDILNRIDTWVTIAILAWVLWQFGANPFKFIYEWFIAPIAGIPLTPTPTPRAEPRPSPRAAAQDGAQPAQGRAATAPDYAQLARGGDDWLRVLNDQPDVNPHLAICGPTRSGKTTLVTALLVNRPGSLVIATPKGADTDPWGGFPAVRLAYDAARGEVSYAPIGAAIRAVYQEMNRRNAQPGADRAPLTLVIDELTTVNYELREDKVMEMIARLWTMGASCGVRVITLDPTVNVKGWGIEGRSDLRESLVFVRCQPDKSANYYRWSDEARAFPIDTMGLPAVAARGLDPARVWVPPTRVEPAQEAPSAAQWSKPMARTVTAHEAAQIVTWAGDEGKPSRALARKLYAARGGDDADYDGSGAVYQAIQEVLTK